MELKFAGEQANGKEVPEDSVAIDIDSLIEVDYRLENILSIEYTGTPFWYEFNLRAIYQGPPKQARLDSTELRTFPTFKPGNNVPNIYIVPIYEPDRDQFKYSIYTDTDYFSSVDQVNAIGQKWKPSAPEAAKKFDTFNLRKVSSGVHKASVWGKQSVSGERRPMKIWVGNFSEDDVNRFIFEGESTMNSAIGTVLS